MGPSPPPFYCHVFKHVVSSVGRVVPGFSRRGFLGCRFWKFAPHAWRHPTWFWAPVSECLLCSSMRHFVAVAFQQGFSQLRKKGRSGSRLYCVLVALLKAAQKGRIYRFHYCVGIRCQEDSWPSQTDGLTIK